MTPIQQRMFTEANNPSLLARASAIAAAYLNGLGGRRPFPDETGLRGLAAFREALPQQPTDATAVLETLARQGDPGLVAHTGGRYFGFVNGGVTPASLAARWVADAWDQNAALYLTSPLAAELEIVCERWLVELFALPAHAAAGFVTGTASATLCGLAAARNTLLQRLGWDANADGLFGAPPLRVIVGAQAHATVGKALGVLGLGRSRVEPAPTDTEGRILPRLMPKLDSTCIVVLQAGNVNSGAFDDFQTICDMAAQAGAWVHVDGAFGLWAAASERCCHLTLGVNRADSWSVDAHKTLNAPYDCGIVLCRSKQALVQAMQTSASYILSEGSRDGMHLTLDMSRRSRSIELWATMKALGKNGIAELVNTLCANAHRIADGLRRQGFEICNEVVFNQVLVCCAHPSETLATLCRLQAGGVCWCGSATWDQRPVIRISVCSWQTTEDDVNATVAAFAVARAEARAQAGKPDQAATETKKS